MSDMRDMLLKDLMNAVSEGKTWSRWIDEHVSWIKSSLKSEYQAHLVKMRQIRKEAAGFWSGRGRGWMWVDGDNEGVMVEVRGLLDRLRSGYGEEVKYFEEVILEQERVPIRFRTISGDRVKFEIRIGNMSEVAPPDHVFEIPLVEAKKLDFIGGTPLRVWEKSGLLDVKEPEYEAEVLEDGTSEMVSIFDREVSVEEIKALSEELEEEEDTDDIEDFDAFLKENGLEI